MVQWSRHIRYGLKSCGRINLANFSSPQGLTQQGNTSYRASGEVRAHLENLEQMVWEP